MPDFRLDRQCALITGASSGLGAHFAAVLAGQGARVILAARREEQLQQQLQVIRAAGGQAEALCLDVTSADSVNRAVAEIDARWGGADILINNAGIAGPPRPFLDTGEADWQALIDTNLTGAWRVATAQSRSWVDQGRPGVVVNVASIYGLRTGLLKVAYNVAKAGLVQLTRSMAMELVRHDIRVNALCPGWFLTAINQDYFASEAGERYIRSIPMRRLGQLQDLAGPLLLLASGAGAYMTGTTLAVDGGISESPV